MTLKITFAAIVSAFFSLNAFAAGQQSFNLDCPPKSKIVKQFSEVQGKPFPDFQTEDLDFEDFTVWTKWPHVGSLIAEDVDYDLRSAPVAKYKENLKISFDESAILVVILNSKKYPYSYISCRYKIETSDPGYYASSSYGELVKAGLTRIDDGYINYETMVPNGNCKYVGGVRITCTEAAKSVLKNPQIMKQDAAVRVGMTFIK